MTIRSFRKAMRSSSWAAVFVAVAGLSVAGCESGSGGPGVGSVGGAALGAGACRAFFGNNTSAMLIGGAVGGMAGNATIDRQAEQRRDRADRPRKGGTDAGGSGNWISSASGPCSRPRSSGKSRSSGCSTSGGAKKAGKPRQGRQPGGRHRRSREDRPARTGPELKWLGWHHIIWMPKSSSEASARTTNTAGEGPEADPAAQFHAGMQVAQVVAAR